MGGRKGGGCRVEAKGGGTEEERDTGEVDEFAMFTQFFPLIQNQNPDQLKSKPQNSINTLNSQTCQANPKPVTSLNRT